MSTSSASPPTPTDSTIGNISQDMHIINLAPIKPTIDSIGLPARTIAAPILQSASQQHAIAPAVGQPITRVISTNTQTTTGTSLPVTMPTSNIVVIGAADNLAAHKQVSIGLPVVTTIASAASSAPLVGRPVTSTMPLTVVPSHIPVSTTYHVPRGAAAVANISAPRSAVATPIVRVGSNLQPAGVTGTSHTTSFMASARGVGPRTLTPVVGTTWVSSTPLQTASGIPRATVFTQVRAPSMTVTARPVGLQINKMQSDTTKQQILHSPGQKLGSIQHATTQSQVQMPDKGFFKTTVSVQSSLGPVTIAQLLPAARGQGVTYASSPLTAVPVSAAPFPLATTTHQLVQTGGSQPVARQTVLPTTTSTPARHVTPARLAVSTQGMAAAVPGALVAVSGAPRLATLAGNTLLSPTQQPNTTTVLTAAGGSRGNAILTGHTRLTVAQAVPRAGNPTVIATMGANTVISSPARLTTAAANINQSTLLAAQVITQAAHGPSIQLTQVPASSFASKMPQALHGVMPLQQTALAITTVSSRPTTFTTSSSLPVSNIRPITMTSPPTRVYSQQAVGEITLPVHTIQAQQTQHPTTQQHAPTQHQNLLQAAPGSNPVYFYESTGYPMQGIAGSIVTRPFPAPASSFPQNTSVQGHQVHGAATTLMTSGTPVRFNPVMVMDPTRSTTVPVQSYLTEGTPSQTDNASVPASPNHLQTLTKPNASPRPSILRKRDFEGSPLKAQKNLTPVLVAMGGNGGNGGPPSPPSPRRPDSRGNGGGSSNGSTTISATSSPGLGEVCDDSQPSSVKLEPIDEAGGERPPVEMSPRKKPRKQQLTGNELHEPKFSEDDMEFITDDKVRRDVLEVAEEFRERAFVPKRPKVLLRSGYRHTWKSQHNHFVHYDNVKVKDSRPTVTDVANQKGIMEKLNGWKIFHLSTQMEELSELETSVVERLSSTLKVMEVKGAKDIDYSNRINELIKGNIQRSKVIKDQMQEAVSQMMKIFDHKEHVTDILTRSANKRTLKKREKM